MTQTPAPRLPNMPQKSDPLAMLSVHRDPRFSWADQESALRRFLAVIDGNSPSNWRASRGLIGWPAKMGDNLQGTPADSLLNRPWLFRDGSFGPVITLHPAARYPDLDGLEGLIGYLAGRQTAPDVYVIPEGSWERTGQTVLVMLPAGFETIAYLEAAGWIWIPPSWRRPHAIGPDLTGYTREGVIAWIRANTGEPEEASGSNAVPDSASKVRKALAYLKPEREYTLASIKDILEAADLGKLIRAACPKARRVPIRANGEMPRRWTGIGAG